MAKLDFVPDKTSGQTLFAPLRHSDLGELTYEAIRHKILYRQLATGSQIPVDLVALELGVSRTPVIDALKRLAAEGLVEIRARRGCFVRGLSSTDIKEIFDIREAAELHGLRLAVRENRHRALAKQLASLSGKMKKFTRGEHFLDYDQFIEWDRAFHRTIITACSNLRLNEIYNNLHVHLHIMRVHYVSKLETATEVNADHDLILSALTTGDLVSIESAITGHLNTIKNRMIVNLERDGQF